VRRGPVIGVELWAGLANYEEKFVLRTAPGSGLWGNELEKFKAWQGVHPN